MKSAAVAVLLCSSFLWAGSGQKPTETLVITNVNVIDTRYGGLVPNVAVVADDGIIKAVARLAMINPGPHVQVINAGGKYLVPGLWDMNSHLAGHTGRERRALSILYLAHGITGVRDLDAQQIEIAQTATPSPEIVTVGPSLHPELAPREAETLAERDPQAPDPNPAASVRRQLELLAQSGSTPLQALQSNTYNAALYMAKLDKYGVIERGHVADMVLLDQNPLSDIRNLEKISGVVLRGAYLSRSDLDALLAQAGYGKSEGEYRKAEPPAEVVHK